MDYWEVLNRSASLPELSALTRMGSELLFLGKGTGMGLAIFRVSLSLLYLASAARAIMDRGSSSGGVRWKARREEAGRIAWSHRERQRLRDREAAGLGRAEKGVDAA